MCNYDEFRFGTPRSLREPLLHYTLRSRFNHFYIIGNTGSGKTSTMERMAYHDIKHGHAVVFIDIKGTHARRLYSLAPDKSKVRYVSYKHPISLNPLSKNYSIDMIIDEFIQVLDILISGDSSNVETTARMKGLLTSSVPFFPENKRNVSDLFKFFCSKEYRTNIIDSIHDNENVSLYWKDYETVEGFKQRETGVSIRDRLSAFVFSPDFLPFIMGENEFDVKDYADNGKTLLVDCSGFSDRKRMFLINLIVFSVYSYATKIEMDHIDEDLIPPCFLFVDEFQSCLSESFVKLLEKSRSAKVGFTLAHQSFHSIKNKQLMDAIFSLTPNKIVFGCGHDEAKKLSENLGVNYKDIAMMEDYTAYIKIGADIAYYNQIYTPLRVDKIEIPPEPERKKEHNFHSDGWIAIIDRSKG